jgi:thioredoxin-like negative regulator of GroEL
LTIGLPLPAIAKDTPMPAVIDTRGRDFEATLASARQPVLVDFSASWCGIDLEW